MSTPALPYDRLWGPIYGSAAFSVASSSATKLVDGVAGKSIWVLSYTFVSTAENSIAFEDEDGNVLGGPMACAANGGVSSSFNPAGHFRVPLGKDLMMDNSAADQVGGHVTYTIV